MKRIRKSVLRALAITAAATAFLTARGDAVPTYYTKMTYYSDASYSTAVGGWRSCPPSLGGYTKWGVTSSYSIHTEGPHVCELAE